MPGKEGYTLGRVVHVLGGKGGIDQGGCPGHPHICDGSFQVTSHVVRRAHEDGPGLLVGGGDEDGHQKIHWLAWDRLMLPKGLGSMGFWDMPLFNQALLAR
jgi:hypothetical protein